MDMSAHIKKEVKKHYGELVSEGSSCCGPESTSCCGSAPDVVPAEQITQIIGYTEAELSALPEEAKSTFGCGNPLAFSDVRPGEVVLDLGSGIGMDAILAARKVGEGGRVIGVDMTPAMIEKAEQNVKFAGVDGIVEFRLGEIEDLPVEAESVDWIISNCVINLSPDKPQVFREAYRALKPGGRLLVSDIVAANLPQAIKEDISAWAGCIAGALEETEYLDAIRQAGFAEVAIVERVDFSQDFLSGDATEALAEAYVGDDGAKVLEAIEKADPAERPQVLSVRVSAVKPPA